MSGLISWLISALVAVLLVGFVFYLVGLRRLPMGTRPRTPSYNRLGEFIGLTENPDYHENPGEDPAKGPDIAPDQAKSASES